MYTTAWMASTVNLPVRKLNWFSERLFSPTMWLCSRCGIISSRSFPIVYEGICLWDEASSRSYSFFLRRTNLCVSHSSKNLPPRRHHFTPCHPHCVFQQPNRLRPTKLIYEPGFLKVFSEVVVAESSCVPGRASSFAFLSVHRVTLFLYAELDAPVAAQGSHLEYAPVAYPWSKTGRGNREVNNRPPGPSSECHLSTPV